MKNENHFFGYVFFATARVRPANFWRGHLLRFIRVLTCSPICHVAIGFDGVVLHPKFGGNEYWPLDVFVERFPTLCAVFRVPFTYAIDLSYYEYGVNVPKRPWPTVLRWLRQGSGEWTEDCLCIALACLQAGGVDVPYDIATPVGLYRWLAHQGYPHATDLFDNREGFHDSARQLLAD